LGQELLAATVPSVGSHARPVRPCLGKRMKALMRRH
jgi:hypothetical protein